MSDAIRDGNHVPVALGVSSADSTVPLPLKINSTTGGLIIDSGGSQFLLGDGTAAAPSYSFTNATGNGMWLPSASSLGFSTTGTERVRIVSGGLNLNSTGSLSWASGAFGSAGDSAIFLDAANTLAQRNGTNAQAFRIYNTYTDASNNERLEIGANVGGVGANSFGILTVANGTGTSRSLSIGTEGSGVLSFRVNGGSRWRIDANGHYIAVTDNTYDIGASGATRPRTIYAANAIYTASTGNLGSDSRGYIKFPSDGTFTLLNNAGTDFTQLNFGGTTSSFPSINKSGTQLRAILADLSAYVGFRASYLQLGTASLIRNPSDGVFTLLDSAETSFARLQFGGTTSSFPAIKRINATLESKLADDSAYAAFSALSYNVPSAGTYKLGGVTFVSQTAPTVASGFGSSPAVVANGTAAFQITIGTGGTDSSGVLTMPAATTGWNCHVENITATAANRANQRTVQTASTTTSITIQNQTISTGAALAWTAGDVLRVIAVAY